MVSFVKVITDIVIDCFNETVSWMILSVKMAQVFRLNND